MKKRAAVVIGANETGGRLTPLKSAAAGAMRNHAELHRARAYEDDKFKWSIRRVPEKLEWDKDSVDHPTRTCGIFVVHGIGEQAWTETSATLRSGFEKAAYDIRKQRERGKVRPATRARVDAFERQGPPPPFIWDGFWANYGNLKETFPEDWEKFYERERLFFSRLWKLRLSSIPRTYFWFLWQTVRLLDPRVLWKVGPLAWLLYWPLQIVVFATVTVAAIRYPRLVTGFLQDVRLYLDPRGAVERAIVQRIDKTVGAKMLRMIGLNWEFRPLAVGERIGTSQERIRFDRVVWVAHSLGTVISYNVLSDLFHRAAELEQSGDDQQKVGVQRFRRSLRRFVTLGSPLNKVGFLFGTTTLRPWPKGVERTKLLDAGEPFGANDPTPEWWVNFYHVLDPVSGALSKEMLGGTRSPANFHIGLFRIPGLAHVAYWKDLRVLRYVLSRTYGAENMPAEKLSARSPTMLSLIAVAGYVVWAGLIAGVAAAAIDLAWHFLFGEHLFGVMARVAMLWEGPPTM